MGGYGETLTSDDDLDLIWNMRHESSGSGLAVRHGLGLSTVCFADETVVLLRHGEKPAAGLGPVNCQSL